MCKIGLYNLEPHIFNIAMMKVSQYHKDQGDLVEIYNHLLRLKYDKVYAFSIFDFTPKHFVTPEMICGGTGFDVKSKLPFEIEQCDPDYSIFPDCTTSYVWFSRGCIRNCPFCVVRQKEGLIKPVQETFLNPHGRTVDVMDNNFFANPEWKAGIRQLQERGLPVNFHGVDVRLLTKEKIDALLSLRHYRKIKIAWDDPKINLIPQLKKVLKWIKPWRLECYVLVGYWSTEEEDLYRIETLRGMGVDPFVMPYDKFNPYQKKIARYVNKKQIFKICTWKEYDS